jgi:predicted methyltransferase
MTLLPNETVTTKPAIDKAHGKVLTYGLGLGYFAFMASAKHEVDSVTIVERSADVIELFKTWLLPYFPNKDKIRIVCERLR